MLQRPLAQARRNIRPRVRTPPPAESCIHCGTTEPPLIDLRCEHKICEPCKIKQFLAGQTIDCMADWYMSIDNDTHDFFVSFARVSLCPLPCAELTTVGSIRVDQTPICSPAIHDEIRWKLWLTAIEESQRDKRRLLRQLGDNDKITKDLTPDFQAKMASNQISMLTNSNQLFVHDRRPMRKFLARSLMLVRVIGSDENNQKSIYIWCKQGSLVKSLVNIILSTRKGEYWDGDLDSQPGFFRTQSGKFGDMTAHTSLKDHGIRHQDTLIMKYTVGEHF